MMLITIENQFDSSLFYLFFNYLKKANLVVAVVYLKIPDDLKSET